ncbi:viroplasmin family protein [Clostridium sp. 19966]|uniref:ribonuclease H family protein n=1 Tax=Clostridium sp. 19966 TaxID=2768166 RepID=UPI0028DE56EB|nr:ribonuclease H family protein [Clostridium sp. 19966]MDT8719101.1 viroplasmin family protein [Clostridium sp. 19966]
MPKKVYAIKEGFDFNKNEKIIDTITYSWSECEKYIKGVKGAKYKSFENIEAARKYLSEGNNSLKKGKDQYPMDCLHIYVDGSYNSSSEKYAYGLVAVRNEVIEYIEANSSIDNSQKSIRQIAGELEAAVKAVEYALGKGDKKVVIFHDYEGVCHHATGFWDRKEKSSEEYYNKMQSLFKQGIEVIFVKVDSHTGDFFNELVDEECKEKLSIKSDKVVSKWLSTNIVKVANEELKAQILKIAPDSSENIAVVNNSSNNVSNTIDESHSYMIEKFKSLVEEYKSFSKSKEQILSELIEKEQIEFIKYLLNLI